MGEKMSDTDFDFEDFEDFTGPGPFGKNDAYYAWYSQFDHKRDHQKLSHAVIIEFMRTILSYPPLVEDARQVIRREDEMKRLEMAGVDMLEASKRSNETYPIETPLRRISDFEKWFFYQKKQYFDHLFHGLMLAFEKMVRENAPLRDDVILDYVWRQPGAQKIMDHPQGEGDAQ